MLNGAGRKRNPGWRYVALLALLGTTTALTAIPMFTPTPAHAQVVLPVRAYVIPAGPLAVALNRFAEASQLQLIYSSAATRGLSSSGLSGSYAPGDALAILLAGSGLTYRFNENGSATIIDPSGSADSAEQISESGLALDTITVTGRGVGAAGQFGEMTADTPYETAAAVSTSDASDIGVRNAGSAINVLRTTPGTFTREAQGGGGIGVNIRGSEGFGRVNTMVDGVRQQNPFLGHYGNGGNVYLMPEMLAGVDVSRGAVSGAHGFNALSGAANFRTLTADDVLLPGQNIGGMTRMAFGTNGYNWSRVVAGAGRVESAGIDVVGAFGMRESDDYQSGLRTNGRRYTRLGSWEDPAVTLLKIGIAPPDSDHSLQAGVTLYGLNANQKVSNNTYSLKYAYTPDSDWVDLRAHAYRNDYTMTLASGLSVRNDALGAEISNRSHLGMGGVDVTLDYGGALYRDNVTHYDESGTNDFTMGDAQRFGDGVRTTGGAYGSATLSKGVFDLTLGLRYDIYGMDGIGGPSVPGDVDTALRVDTFTGSLSPTARISAQWLPWLQTYASYGRTYRAPTVAETLMPGAHGNLSDSSANPGLRGEVGLGWEGGVNVMKDDLLFAGDRLRLKAHYFQTDVTNYILDNFKFENAQGATRIHGVELEGRYDAGFAYLSAAYTRSQTALPTGMFVGNTASVYGKLPEEYWTIDGGIRFLDERLTLGGRVRYVGESRFVTGFPARNVEVPAYMLADLYVSFKPHERAELFATIENVEDKLYRSALNAYAPNQSSSYGRGRTFMGGFNLKF